MSRSASTASDARLLHLRRDDADPDHHGGPERGGRTGFSTRRASPIFSQRSWGAAGIPVARAAAPVIGETYYPRLHYGWSELTSIRDDRYKYVLAPRPELYDLQADRGETRNLAPERPQQAQAMDAALRRLSAGARPPVVSAPAIDADAAERLQALGYIGAISPKAIAREATLADPKDKIGLYTTLKEALLIKQRGNLDGAIPSDARRRCRGSRDARGALTARPALMAATKFDEGGIHISSRARDRS